MRVEARLSEDLRSVHMRRGGWSITFPAADLPRWIALYRRLRDRKHGKWAATYAPDVAALERVEIELRRG